MCTHTPVGFKLTTTRFQHQSVAVNLVPNGRFDFAAQEKLLEYFFFPFHIYGQGGNARNLFDLTTTNKQQAKLLVVPRSKRFNAF